MLCENCGRRLNDGEKCNCDENNPEQSERQEKSGKADQKEKARKALVGIIIGAALSLTAAVAPDLIERYIDESTTRQPGFVANEGAIDELAGEFVLASSAAEYTPGVLNGSYYENEWANLEIDFGTSFENAPPESYEPYENILFDCGAYFVAEDGDEIGIAFYRAGDMSVKEYSKDCIAAWLDNVKDSLSEVFSEEYIKNISYDNKAQKVEIAGEYYLGSFFVVNYNGDPTFVFSDFCAEKDNTIIDIIVISDSIERCIALAGCFNEID